MQAQFIDNFYLSANHLLLKPVVKSNIIMSVKIKLFHSGRKYRGQNSPHPPDLR